MTVSFIPPAPAEPEPDRVELASALRLRNPDQIEIAFDGTVEWHPPIGELD
jgi:hypothetical protein